MAAATGASLRELMERMGHSLAVHIGLFWGRSPVEDGLRPGVSATIGGLFGPRGD